LEVIQDSSGEDAFDPIPLVNKNKDGPSRGARKEGGRGQGSHADNADNADNADRIGEGLSPRALPSSIGPAATRGRHRGNHNHHRSFRGGGDSIATSEEEEDNMEEWQRLPRERHRSVGRALLGHVGQPSMQGGLLGIKLGGKCPHLSGPNLAVH
jgi:hypothetical protein